ncbi:hypothetical protein CN643_17720, partial [Parageobacillus yumthangensis]
MTEMPYLCWAFLYTSTGVNSYYLGLYYLQTIRKHEFLSPELRKENEKATLYKHLFQALDKGFYLGDQLIREGKEELGSEGKNFVRWLYEQLDKINKLSRSAAFTE